MIGYLCISLNYYYYYFPRAMLQHRIDNINLTMIMNVIFNW